MQAIAKRYIAGESITRLAAEHGINESTLYDRLEVCSDKWVQTFNTDKLNIHERIVTSIPPLLDAKTIKAIRKRAEANKTYSHGQLKNKYLLGRMIFCTHCGRPLTGQPCNGYLYYRHLSKKAPCPFKGNVRADAIENVVIRHLFECFGNPKAVQRAIEAATPNRAKIEEHRASCERLANEQSEIEKARDRILGLVERNSIEFELAAIRLDKLKEREAVIAEELARLQESIKNVPTREQLEYISVQVASKFNRKQTRRRVDPLAVVKRIAAHSTFNEMTWEDQRSLIEEVFAGKTPDGKRMGVYIEPADGKPSRWKYTIRGILLDAEGKLLDVEGSAPMTESRLEAVFGETDDFGRPTSGSNGASPQPTTKLSSVTKPARWAPIRRQRYCRRDRNRRRGGG
jgi:site-specific DNA recombinase